MGHNAKKAGEEVVQQVDSPLVSGLLYPGMQALDEEYLGVDFQFRGVDQVAGLSRCDPPRAGSFQRKIFTLAKDVLPRFGYRQRAHLMNAMVPGLAGGKMTSSDPKSKIDLLDPREAIKEKVDAAPCKEGDVENNGLLSFFKAVLIPIALMRAEQRPFVLEGAPPEALFSIVRPEKYGGPMHFASYVEVHDAFAAKEIHPRDLKNAVGGAIVAILDPIRKAFGTDPEFQAVEQLAYPVETKPTKRKTPKSKSTEQTQRQQGEQSRG